MHDEKTTNYLYPLPHRDNILLDDVERIRQSFILIDSEIKSLYDVIDEKTARLEQKLNAKTSGQRLVLYIDEDGDIAQNAGEDENNNASNIATDDEVDAMLDEIYGD